MTTSAESAPPKRSTPEIVADLRTKFESDLDYVAKMMEEHQGGECLEEDDDSFCDPSREVGEFRDTLVMQSLSAAGDVLDRLYGEAMESGATRDSPMITAGQARIYPCSEATDHFKAIAIEHGDDRFVVSHHAVDGNAKTMVARWKPTLEEATRAQVLASLGEDPTALEVVRAASFLGRFSPEAVEHSQIAWSVSTRPSERMTVLNGGTGRSPGAFEDWCRFAEVLRPLVIGSLGPVKQGQRYATRSSYLAEDAIAADGRFQGEVSVLAAAAVAEVVAKRNLRAVANNLHKLGKDTLAEGYAWPAKKLQYADLDRYTCAVASPDGKTVGRWHRNIDLIVDLDQHMVVVTEDDLGQPASIQVFPVYQAAGRILWEAGDNLQEILGNYIGEDSKYADEEADPPRLSLRMLAERISNGIALPSPAGGIDLLTGELLPGTVEDRLGVLQLALYGYVEDRFAMRRISQGKLPGYVRNDMDVEEEGEKIERLSHATADGFDPRF